VTNNASDVANALLRLGALDPADPEQASLREELFANTTLWDDVAKRIEAVGYDLVQLLGHVGVRVSRTTAVDPLVTARNNLGLDARHVRVLVYLWVQLVYRHLKEMLRDEKLEPAGRSQTFLGLEDVETDEPPKLAKTELEAEFKEEYSRSALKAALTTLKKGRFVRESEGLLTAGPALYVLLDHDRMEEYVVGLARKDAFHTVEVGADAD